MIRLISRQRVMRYSRVKHTHNKRQAETKAIILTSLLKRKYEVRKQARQVLEAPKESGRCSTLPLYIVNNNSVLIVFA